MKKVDKLILGPFLKLFVLNFFVVLFVLLMQFFLIYFDELIGKGLGMDVYMQLSFYFIISATPKTFPLAILVASIVSLGNLGEHCELIALKSAGISLPRVLMPLFIFVGLLSIAVFFSNSYVVPKATLEALGLLHDLRKKKPSLSIKEGIFYDGIPGYSIKVSKKLPDQKTLQGIMIYDHTKEEGNVSLTMAETGMIYMIQDEAYLVIELFNGRNYIEEPAKPGKCEGEAIAVPQLYRSSFKFQKLVISLESFKLSRTKQEFLSNYRKAKNVRQLATEAASMKNKVREIRQQLEADFQQSLIQSDKLESANTIKEKVAPIEAANILHLKAYLEQQQLRKQQQVSAETAQDLPVAPSSPYEPSDLAPIISKALEQAKKFKNELISQLDEITYLQKKINGHEIEKHKMISLAVNCLVVLLIGASLGAIIKKGGLGVPVIIAVCLITFYYIIDVTAEKWASLGLINAFSGAWIGNLVAIPFGLFFLRQAYKDTRLLEADFYAVLWERIKKYVHEVKCLCRFTHNS